MVRRAVVLLALIAAGCFKGPAAPDIVAGQPFELKAGATATLPDGARLRFERVAADSRCPMDALCVWAGDATVAVSVSQPGRAGDARELHTFEPFGSQISYAGYRIALTALAPYPQSSQNIRPADYVATFVVSVR